MNPFYPCMSCAFRDDCSQDKVTKDFECKDYVFMDDFINETITNKASRRFNNSGYIGE